MQNFDDFENFNNNQNLKEIFHTVFDFDHFPDKAENVEPNSGIKEIFEYRETRNTETVPEPNPVPEKTEKKEEFFEPEPEKNFSPDPMPEESFECQEALDTESIPEPNFVPEKTDTKEEFFKPEPEEYCEPIKIWEDEDPINSPFENYVSTDIPLEKETLAKQPEEKEFLINQKPSVFSKGDCKTETESCVAESEFADLYVRVRQLYFLFERTLCNRDKELARTLLELCSKTLKVLKNRIKSKRVFQVSEDYFYKKTICIKKLVNGLIDDVIDFTLRSNGKADADLLIVFMLLSRIGNLISA